MPSTYRFAHTAGCALQINVDQVRERRPRRHPLQMRCICHDTQMLHFRIRHVLGCQYGLHTKLGTSIDCLSYVVLKVKGICAQLVWRRC